MNIWEHTTTMRLYLKTKDYFKTNEEFELLYNEDLDLLQTNPQPENLDSYYESEGER